MILVADANRARRRRRQTQTILNSAQPANRNSQVDARQLPFNNQGLQQQQQQQSQMSQGGMGVLNNPNAGQNQGGRQFYPNQNQYGMGSQGSQGSFYNPYGGSQYGYGQCKHQNLCIHTD